MARLAVPAPAAPRAVRLVDGLLAAVTVVAVLAGTARLGGRLDAAGALPLALWLGLLLLAHRRWPLAVLLLSVQAVVVFRTSGLTDAGWVWPVSAAYVALAADDRPGRPGLRWAAGVGLTELAFAVTWETTAGGAAPREGLGSLGAESLWLAVLLAAAAAYRNHLRWRAELDTRLLRAVRERDLEAGRRIAEARLDIARELHDVVGHTLTVVGIQLRVAVEALDDSPQESRAALTTAQQVRTQAVRDLRALVHVLRAPGETPEGPAAGAPEVAALVDRMRSAELDIRLETSGDLAAVPAPVSLAVHRIVQEALTNTVRHAGASRADVTVRCGRGRVEVRVTDDGRAPTEAPAAAGHGVRGMDERVRALGGDFSAGSHGRSEGWVVWAAIPVPGFRP
ncbi:sensor histidine kinase [Streptomyces hainanensis]|uniref:histidine kinase n=1 Tax=Streptomyces hainanensis TaxID=402648 RepID=A0A4V2Y3G4_9ACTN|nr:histidine kinase [Streptomyces hainanensis]TDC76425.1 sensor histidine kinase [Streptomyces hainanensis]